jgi:hypothetical protein
MAEVILRSRTESALVNSRLLFVVSGAYGDLTLAVTFLLGQELTRNAALALTPRLYDANRETLPIPVHRYASSDEILAAASGAAIVFFLSAYGLPIERVVSPDGLGLLIQRLRANGCRVVTTDPFLGSASTVTTAQIRGMLPPRGSLLRRILYRPGARQFVGLLNATSVALHDVVHLYPAPTDGIAAVSGLRRMSFFNPQLVDDDPVWDDLVTGPPPGAVPTWLFVLGSNDLVIQERKWGHAEFLRRLGLMFEQAYNAERRPVLVAPGSLLDELAGDRGQPEAVDLVPFASYRDFSARLRAAEYAFYWNLFSCSAYALRLARKRPLVYFDQGHVAQFGPVIHRDAVRCYFGGYQPAQRQHGELRVEELPDLAREQRRAVDGLIAYWRQSPTPGEVVDAVLHDAVVQT